MKFRVGLAALLMMVTSLMVTTPVSAHVGESDQAISAEMHLPPDDQAVVGRQQQIEFIFADMPATFSLRDCDCSLQVASKVGEPTKVSTQLNGAQTDRLTSRITFARASDYTLTLTGYTSAKHAERFKLVYDLYVKAAPRVVSSAAKRTASIVLVICSLAVIGVIVLSYYYRAKLRRSA